VTDVLRIGVAVATPLSLLGLIAALSYYFYSRHLKSEEKKLEALPLEQRARLADQRLSRYGIDGANLTRDEKTRLILEEMDKRYRFARLCTIIFAVVFVICFGLASSAFILTGRSAEHRSNEADNVLNDQLEAMKARERTRDATLELLIIQIKELDAREPRPGLKELLDDLKKKVEGLKSRERVTNETLGAVIAKVQRFDRQQATPELTQFLVTWHREIDRSDEATSRALLDPSLSEEDKRTLLIMSILKGLDRDVEEQVRLVNSIKESSSTPGAPSINVETMKLKRLIDKRSHMFDVLHKEIDEYNQRAKDIIDSIP
jgi:hypothetical protein